MTQPSGFSASEATFAISFEVPAPTDAVSPVRAVIRARSASATSRTCAASPGSPPGIAARSTKASSRLTGSTSGESSRSSSITTVLTA